MFKILYSFAFLLFAIHPSFATEPCLGLGNDVNMCSDVKDKNVVGENLELCCNDPITGFYRNGFCQTGKQDVGTHVVCAKVTQEFLEFSASKGNDLMTPFPDYNFPGLKDGDKWCLCANRWTEALEAGVAPPLVLEATHSKMLEYAEIEVLKKHAYSEEKAAKISMANAYQFTFKAIDGTDMPLYDFKGKALLIVNTASQKNSLV